VIEYAEDPGSGGVGGVRGYGLVMG
jgi:hypothetical protein